MLLVIRDCLQAAGCLWLPTAAQSDSLAKKMTMLAEEAALDCAPII